MEKSDELKKYEEYFGEDLERLETEISKSENLFGIIEKNIKRIENSESRGSYHYLIEHFKNIIALQTQKQGLLRDRVALKKLILDFAEKNTDNSSDKEEVMKQLAEYIKSETKRIKESVGDDHPDYPEMPSDEELDKMIDETLEEDK